MIRLDIVREAGDWAAAADLDADAQRAAEAALASVPDAPDEPLGATLLLTDDAAIRVLNRTWRGLDEATNVLSFPSALPPQPGEPRHLGDVAMAYETLVREAALEGKPLAHHVAHLVVHGVLHLLGRDHGTDREADDMERTEIAALAALGIPDPYRDASP